MNDQIRAREVRLIGQEGEQLGIKPISEALHLADEAGLDLVEVAPDAVPPVCRIMDYGRYKYLQRKRAHDPKKRHHVPQLKELRLRPKTERHDLEVRLKQARHFLQRGDRVLVTVVFRGREIAHAELGRAMLNEFAEALNDVAKIEKEPLLENRRLTMLLTQKPQGAGARPQTEPPESQEKSASEPAQPTPPAPR